MEECAHTGGGAGSVMGPDTYGVAINTPSARSRFSRTPPAPMESYAALILHGSFQVANPKRLVCIGLHVVECHTFQNGRRQSETGDKENGRQQENKEKHKLPG